jgi:hypothetical protein
MNNPPGSQFDDEKEIEQTKPRVDDMQEVARTEVFRFGLICYSSEPVPYSGLLGGRDVAVLSCHYRVAGISRITRK